MKQPIYKIFDNAEKGYVYNAQGTEPLVFNSEVAADNYIWEKLSDYYVDKPISVFKVMQSN